MEAWGRTTCLIWRTPCLICLISWFALHVALSGSGPSVGEIIEVTRGKGDTMGTTDVAQVSELRDLIAQFARRDGDHGTSIASLSLMRRSSCVSPQFIVLSPALCIAAQGQKVFLLGEEEYSVGSGHYLVASTHLPVSARILEATPVKPFLGLRLGFDLTSLRSLIEEARLPTPVAGASTRGLYVSWTAPPLLDALLRLLRLLQSPAEIPVLAPMIEREILFRLLLDEGSLGLHRMAQEDSPPQRISVAIVWLRKHFRESFRVDDLARRVGMSGSSFRQSFRSITGMSPLQYQKQLRLQEARSILRNERKDVGTVSRCVGYESCSQFSREYSRLFGNPPVREISKGNPSKASLNDSS
jgi:AraC-like DNA-binding protein